MTANVPRLPFSLDPLMAEAKRRMRKRRVLVAVLAVLIGGGVVGAAVGLTSSSAVQPAGRCKAGGYQYAYAVPPDPQHPPAAGSGATSWGWQPHLHPLKVGNWVRGMDGHMWKVTAITTVPGVEPLCRPFAILGWPQAGGEPVYGHGALVMAGRLVLQPVG
jgi:hypothetical protein